MKDASSSDFTLMVGSNYISFRSLYA